MGWTTPATRATDDIITESIWNADIVDNLNYLKDERDTAINASPVGHMVMWPTNTAPSLWLLCYGQAVSRTGYSALFAVIGTTFGSGDGTTTFNLPDLRGRFPLGQDDMGGSSANRVTSAQADTIGGSSGAETHTLTIAELASHSHTVLTSGSGTTTGPVSTDISGDLPNSSLSPAGGGGAHNNMPPYLTLNFIIYAGV